jgi:hypothetical protein
MLNQTAVQEIYDQKQNPKIYVKSKSGNSFFKMQLKHLQNGQLAKEHALL